MSTPLVEERPGFPGARRAVGGVGGHLGQQREIEERPGFPGARRAVGGVGGHLGAPT